MPQSNTTQAKTPNKAPAIAGLIALVGIPMYVTLTKDTHIDEGNRLHAYRDIGGVWTICDGTTKGVKAGDVATQEECDAKTAADLTVAYHGVTACAPVLAMPGYEQQLRSAIRLSNNIGTGAYCKGWFHNRPSPGKLMQEGLVVDSCLEMLHYDLVKGKVIPGLLARRKRESAICLSTARQTPDLRFRFVDWTVCRVNHYDQDPLGPEPKPANMFPRRMDRA